MEQKQDLSLSFANNLIAEYYKTCTDLAPDRMIDREFGVGNYDVKISQRHMSFRNESELKAYLSGNCIPYVSVSPAYYKFPTGRPMDRKGILGAELVFDLDATDMDLKCYAKHGKGWICANCLEEVKAETLKLIYEFLVPDFGFAESEIFVNFSGNRGYHVHVRNKDVLPLDTAARKEISSYVSGTGINFDELFRFGSYTTSSERQGRQLMGPKPTDKGWKGKVAKKFVESLNAGIDSLVQMGLDRDSATKLYRKKELMKLGLANGNWDMIAGIRDKEAVWKGMVDKQAISQSDKIDKVVTNDPTHLLRLPNSIHGGTGLIAKKLKTPRELYRFDPMREAIAFRKGFVKMSAHTDYEIVMNGTKFGPYAGEVKVPTYVAAYLYLRGFAKVTKLD